MGNTHISVPGLCALAITTACAPRPAAEYPDVVCIVDDGATETLALSEEIVRISPPAIELVLDEYNGGPLRCRPSSGCGDAFVCVGGPVAVQVGSTLTLKVGVRTIERSGISVAFDEVTLSGDSAFQMLQPILSALDSADEQGAFFVQVTPTSEGVISADLEIRSNARNMPDGEPLSITLQVEGVQP